MPYYKNYVFFCGDLSEMLELVEECEHIRGATVINIGNCLMYDMCLRKPLVEQYRMRNLLFLWNPSLKCIF